MTRKIALQCDNCNYKFKRSVAPKLCPNCGRNDVVSDRRMGAEEILQELDEMSKGFD